MADAEKKWAYKLADTKECWKDLVSYSADTCADDTVTAADAAGHVTAVTSKEGAFANGVYVKTCGEAEIVMGAGDTEDAAKAVADGDAPVKLAYTHDGGKAKCVVWSADPAIWVSFTAEGWAEETAEGDTSGAKHLGAAFAAGALAIAATQF